jgi:MurNAc alpha-1-phosphate uridylyltransferase
MIKKAMILAAGFGKRLHPLTLKCPKPLLKVGNETLLSNTIKFLTHLGLEEVVINVHYLSDQIINYIDSGKFKIKIILINEKNKLLDTGGGVLNAISYFSNSPFIIINPDTIWGMNYIEDIKKMENFFFNNNKIKCSLLVVSKEKSFDKSLKTDFILKNNLIKRAIHKNDFEYIYTGLQIIRPETFLHIDEKIFSINKVWDKLIENEELYGIESSVNFMHISTLKIYQSLDKKLFKY